MQTQTLLPQIPGAGQPSPRQNPFPAAESGGVQFSQALSREIAQRQDMSPAAPQAKPAAQQKPAERTPAPRQEPARPAQADPARQAGAKTESKPAASPAKADDEGAAKEAEAAARAAELPVTDLLALVASFNQLLGAAPKEAPAAGNLADGGVTDGGVAAMADGLEAGLAAGQFAQGATLALGEPAADGQGAGGVLARAAADAATGADAAAADAPAIADVAGEPSRFADALRERAEPLALKDVGAAAAPAGAAVQQAALNVAQAASGVATDKLQARVGTPAWDNQVGQKIVWMVAGKEQSATLTLNPPDLGPVQVVLNVTNDQANVAFSASQLEVRQALENAMPKLREMMDQNGIALGNATVDAGMPDQRQAQGGQQAEGARSGSRLGGNGGGVLEAPAPQAGRAVSGGAQGLVDTFA